MGAKDVGQDASQVDYGRILALHFLQRSSCALLLSSMSFIARCQVVSSMTILPVLPISQVANHSGLARSSHSYAQR